jgi:hypothetical protein
MRRGHQDLNQVGLGVVLMVAEHLCAHAFARQGEGDQDDPASGLGCRKLQVTSSQVQAVSEWHAAKPDAEVGEGRDLQLDLLMIGERMVGELFGVSHETHETHETAKKRSDFSFVSSGCFVVIFFPCQ